MDGFCSGETTRSDRSTDEALRQRSKPRLRVCRARSVRCWSLRVGRGVADGEGSAPRRRDHRVVESAGTPLPRDRS
jgi:hypothetical protein